MCIRYNRKNEHVRDAGTTVVLSGYCRDKFMALKVKKIDVKQYTITNLTALEKFSG